MAVPSFKGDLSEPFKAVSFLTVVLDTVLADMAIVAAVHPESIGFAPLPIGRWIYVMPFQTRHPSAEEATLTILDYAFARHDESISSCSFDAGIGRPICSASSIR